MPFPAYLDACVLIPYRLADLLLRLAEANTYRPLWSDEVLGEVERNLPRVGHRTPESARKFVDTIRRVFPDALVTGYESLTPMMTNDPKDRHVLAAAAYGGAAVIVTANIDDFPTAALSPYDLDAVHPDDFLLDQFDLYPDRTVECINDQISAYNKPEVTPEEFLDRLAKVVPDFAAEVRTPVLQVRWRQRL
ncbi:PIN domain-containing protein [Saccharothrix obliqua]|uniref:PIN domain-containing protein n=1 Tax=Saccharothrix obliqua TaxID=2861747 RepID=UPI0027E32DD5|nr:PIN domain-containing protein [Saccharothrix obliqua]